MFLSLFFAIIDIEVIFKAKFVRFLKNRYFVFFVKRISMEEREIVARNITYLRKKYGMSQAELAEKIQYSNKNISKWETGETTPSIFTLKKISELFNVTVDEFVTTLFEEADIAESPTDEAGDNVNPSRKGATSSSKENPKSDTKIILGLPLSIKVLYLLMTEAILFLLAVIAIVTLGLLDVDTFNTWLLLLYVLPPMCLAVFIFIACVKKRVDLISLSLFGWFTALSFYLSFKDAKNVYLVFVLMGAIQLLMICVMLIINLTIVRRVKNKLIKK